MVDGKENDKFDLEVKGLKLFSQPLCICSGVVVFGLRLPGALPRVVFLERTDRVASA